MRRVLIKITSAALLLGIGAGCASPMDREGEAIALARQVIARADLATFADALAEYTIMFNGKYPDDLEALVTPDEEGLTFLRNRTLPLDPWKRAYIYSTSEEGSRYEVKTLGADGKPGGTGADADIVVTPDSAE